MTVYICNEFLADLKRHGDPNFARRVLAKMVDDDGEFLVDADDHRFDGISDAWIRYVSRRSTAYRAIYIRKGRDVYLYRAGEHSVEDHLTAPDDLELAKSVVKSPVAATSDSSSERHRRPSRFLKNCQQRFLRDAITSRRLIPHKSITLISPFISLSLLTPFSPIGKFLDEAKADSASVSIITLPPKIDELEQYERLSARGFDLLFHERLHAKLFIFEINEEALGIFQKDKRSIGIIGSANMTETGWNLRRNLEGQEELCFEIYEEDLNDAIDFACYLTVSSTDVSTLRRKVRFERGRSIK